MTDVICIYLTAWGIAHRLPNPLRRWVSLRALRGVMAAHGSPVDEFSDTAVMTGARQLAHVTDRPSLAMASSLRELIRDSREEAP